MAARLRDVSIRWKLLGTFGGVLLVLALVGASLTWQLDREQYQHQHLLRVQAGGARIARQLHLALLTQVRDAQDAWLRGSDPDAVQRSAETFAAHAAEVRRLRGELAALEPLLTDDERAALRRFDTGWQAYLAAWPRALAAATEAPAAGRAAAGAAVLNGLDREPGRALDSLAAGLTRRRDATAADVVAGNDQLWRMTVGLMAVGLGFGLLLAWLAARAILLQVGAVTRAARRWAGGDLAAQAAVLSGDELGEMAAAFNQMAAAQRQALAAEQAARVAAEAAAQECGALYRAALAIGAELDLESQLERVLDASRTLVGADRAQVALLTPAGDELEMAATGGAGVSRRGLRLPVPDSVIGQVIATHAPVRSADLLADPRLWRREVVEEDGTRAWLGVPLSSAGRAYGVLAVGHARPGTFTAEHEHLLASIAALVSAAVRQAGLRDDAQRELDERRRAEAALRESEARYRSVVDAVQEVVFQVDAAGCWSFLNPAWTALTGLGVSESLGRPVLEQVHPADQDAVRERIGSLLAGEVAEYRRDVRYRAADGDIRWVEVYARAMRANDGAVAGISGTLTDVTARRRLDEERAALLLRERSARSLAERTAARQAALLRIGRHLAAEGDPARLVQALLAEAQRLVGADTGAVYLCDGAPAHLTLGHSTIPPGPDSRPLPGAGAGIAGQAAARRAPVIRAAPAEQPAARGGPRAEMAAPLLHEGRLLGVLSVGRCRSDYPFGAADAETLELLAGVTASALVGVERARLEAVSLAGRELAHRLNNDLAPAVGVLDLLQSEPALPPRLAGLVRDAADGLDAACAQIVRFQRLARFETKQTPMGPALDIERSARAAVGAAGGGA